MAKELPNCELRIDRNATYSKIDVTNEDSRNAMYFPITRIYSGNMGPRSLSTDILDISGKREIHEEDYIVRNKDGNWQADRIIEETIAEYETVQWTQYLS